MSTKAKPKGRKKPRTKKGDVLDVELEVTTRGYLHVEMTREQYAEMKDNERHGAICLDMVPNVDWTGLTEALDFEATIENVYDDDGEIVDP